VILPAEPPGTYPLGVIVTVPPIHSDDFESDIDSKAILALTVISTVAVGSGSPAALQPPLTVAVIVVVPAFLPVTTALLYNNEFYVHAANWCSYCLYKAKKAKETNSTNILKPNWGKLVSNPIKIALGAAASSPGWVDIYPPEDENSNLWISYKKKDNTMHFIYRFDETFKFNHACIQIKLKGLFDLEGNEISVVEIDSDLNEFHEISKKIKVIFDSSFEIFEILIKQ